MTVSILRNIRIETGYSYTDGSITGNETKAFDVLMENGKVKKLSPASTYPMAFNEINGQDLLLLPSIRESHCHFDKVKLGRPWKPVSTVSSLMERVNLEAKDLEKLSNTFEDRMEKLINIEVNNGVTHFRSHIDIYPEIGLKRLERVQMFLENYKDIFSYELVAFPQKGLLNSNSYANLKRALENGADLLGGLDPSSLDLDLESSLNKTFELAVQFGVPIDIHLHDRGAHGRRTIKKIIELTKSAKWQNKVTISHAFGLNDFDPFEKPIIFENLAKEGISIISSVPITMNTIPPLEELRRNNINVSLGCDNIYDSWTPFGDGNILEKLNRYAEIFDLTSQKDLTSILTLVTGISIKENESWLTPGMEANFILVNCQSSAEFVARKSQINSRFYKGKQFIINRF